MSSCRRFAFVAATAVGATVASRFTNNDPFERFFGPMPPVLSVAAVAGIGAVALRRLADRGWFLVGETARQNRTLEGLVLASGAATLLAGGAIAFDNWIHFPEDMNTTWPESLLFYPAIAFVAEIVFHVVPLAVLVDGFRWRLGPGLDSGSLWAATLAVASIEAVFQTAEALAGPDRRVAAFVAPHLLAIGVVGLAMFRRYGFLHMLAFRIVYYFFWHIGWGHLRLRILF